MVSANLSMGQESKTVDNQYLECFKAGKFKSSNKVVNEN